MGINQTEQNKIWVLTRSNRQNTGIGHTEIWVLTRSKIPNYGYWTDKSDRNMGFSQMEHTRIWVFTKPKRPTDGYEACLTDQNMGFSQTKQTQIRLLVRPKHWYQTDRTDPNTDIAQTERAKI